MYTITDLPLKEKNTGLNQEKYLKI